MFNKMLIYFFGRKKCEIHVVIFSRVPRFGDTMDPSKIIYLYY